MRAVINDTKCDSRNYEWTAWNSADSPADLNDDHELLIDHQRLFRFGKNDKFSIKKNLRVCDRPTHIDAREVHSNISWVGSDSLLIHQSAKSFLSSSNEWSHGISKDFG